MIQENRKISLGEVSMIERYMFGSTVLRNWLNLNDPDEVFIALSKLTLSQYKLLKTLFYEKNWQKMAEIFMSVGLKNNKIDHTPEETRMAELQQIDDIKNNNADLPLKDYY
jgi:hypothetical protein